MISKPFRFSALLLAAFFGFLASSSEALAFPMPIDATPIEATPAIPDEYPAQAEPMTSMPSTATTTRLSVIYGGGSHAIGLLSGDNNGTATQMAIVMELIGSGVDEPYLEGVGVDGIDNDWSCFVLLAENIDPAVLATLNAAIAAVLANHPPV